MTSVLLRLASSVVRCTKCGSYSHIIECQKYYWRIAMYINTMKSMVSKVIEENDINIRSNQPHTIHFSNISIQK